MTAIKVPPLGESIVEATVGRWLKKEGDSVAAGDTIVELETDKITVEVPALKGGVLSKQLKAEGDVVKVDETLAELDEGGAASEGGDGGKQESDAQRAGAVKAQESDAQRAGAVKEKTGAGTTGRAESEREPEQEGTGKSAPAARRLATESGVDVGEVRGTGRGGAVSKPDVVGHVAARPDGKEAESREKGGKGDQQGAKEERTTSAPSRQQAPAPQRPAGGDGARETREKMTTRRKRIAEHLLQAKQETANLTTFNEIDMSAVMQLREANREGVEKRHGVKLTYMPFFIKAACQALAEFPNVNAQIDGDSIVYRHYVNMGIAVASEQGLVVPVIKDAHAKGLIELSRDIAAVAKRARDGKLTMDDLTGGTFTVTNGGVFGSLVSTPILNYPQVGILGLHKIQERPVVVDGQIVVRSMMYVALSYDHRIVDGQHSVQFLVRVKELMEEPARMLLEN